ncbi:MAG: PD-(D/E)XK nuclease family protein [Lachnospiraceae bacterium]|nr:PD-(D/E)XK nuclease family protein [Lachnospiraceae bacterium]
MSLRFIIGGSGSGKSSRLQEEIIRRSEEDSGRQFMIVVPDQFTMQTQKEIVEHHPRKGILNIDVQSFGRLCHRIADEVGEQERPVLDDTGKNLILRRLAGRMSGELPVIGSSLSRRGYIQEVKSVISEFIQYGLGPEEVGKLADYASEKKLLSAKLRDLQKIYAAFRDYLGEHFITKEEKLDLLAAQIPRSRLLKGSVVAFDGFTGFTPVQINVIRQLLCCCDELIVTIIMPSNELELYRNDFEEHHLFSLSMRTIRSLEQLAKELGVERGEDTLLDGAPRFSSAPLLAFLERNIFRGGSEVCTEETGNELALFAARNPEEELREIFRRIRRLCCEEGMAYREIAVVTGDPERYAPYVDELASEYGIPVFSDNNRKLEHNPFSEYLRSVLECLDRDMAYENVMHFLRSGLSGIETERIDELDNYLLATGYRGAAAWGKAFVRIPAYMANDAEHLGRINDTREEIWEHLKPLWELGKEAPAEVFVRGLYDFFTADGVYEKLEAYRIAFHDAGDAVREKEYSQVHEQLCKLLEQIALLLEGEVLERKEFTEILLAGIAEIKLGVLPMDADRVVIGDMERTRLKPIRVLFFAGLNDGVIPAAAGSGGMISDIDREFLGASAFELAPTPRQKMFIQRLYLYHALGRPSERLILSCSRTNASGESIRPSYLIDRIRALFPGLDLESAGRREDEMPLNGEMAKMLSEYAEGTLPEEKKALFAASYALFRESDEENCLRMTDAAFYRYIPEPLSSGTVRALYGTELVGSVSRMESYGVCPYAHFLRYALRLRERETKDATRGEMGSLAHKVMELFAGDLEKKGLSWAALSEEQLDEMLPGLVEQAALACGDGKFRRDARSEYNLVRMKRILRRSLLTQALQLSRGSFEPRGFEHSFERRETLSLPDGEAKMRLAGTIDRLDSLETEDAVYLKVTDYKTGKREPDIRELCLGTQLQLPVYLREAVNEFAAKEKGKTFLPAAYFYYIMKDPILKQEAMKDGTEAGLLKELRLTGLIADSDRVLRGLDSSGNEESQVVRVKRKKDGTFDAHSQLADPADLEALLDFAERKLKSMGEEICSGRIAREPVDADRCSYCSFREECPFDLRLPGCRYRGGKLTKEDAWEEIRKKDG